MVLCLVFDLFLRKFRLGMNVGFVFQVQNSRFDSYECGVVLGRGVWMFGRWTRWESVE